MSRQLASWCLYTEALILPHPTWGWAGLKVGCTCTRTEHLRYKDRVERPAAPPGKHTSTATQLDAHLPPTPSTGWPPHTHSAAPNRQPLSGTRGRAARLRSCMGVMTSAWLTALGGPVTVAGLSDLGFRVYAWFRPRERLLPLSGNDDRSPECPWPYH